MTSLRLVIVVLLAGACASSAPSWEPPPPGGTAPAEGASLWDREPPSVAATALYREARRLAGLGHRAAAVDALQRAIGEDAEFLDAHRELQDLLLDSTADWWVRSTYRSLHADNPRSADACYLLARIEPDRQRQAELFDEALELDPRHPYARVGRALGLERSGDLAGALREARLAAEQAPWLPLPWVFLGHVSAAQGEDEAARRFYVEARDRDPLDARAWLGLSRVSERMLDLGASSTAALEALVLEPADEAVVRLAAGALERAGVPADLRAALEVADAALAQARDPALVRFLRARCLVALGEWDGAARELLSLREEGFGEADVGVPLRRSLFAAGCYREAVVSALEALPEGTLRDDNLYAVRWHELRGAAEALDTADARSLLRLVNGAAALGWIDEARIALAHARSVDPDDPALRRRMAQDLEFSLFLEDLRRIGKALRSARRRRDTVPDLDQVLTAVRNASLARLGSDVTEGAVVRSYPLLGSFAVSVGSRGAFEREFGSRGLILLVGQRAGDVTDLALGRLVLVRADAREVVEGRELGFDECWIESAGLPPDLAGLRGGLAGLTIDRLVLVQLDAVRRRPRPLENALPFERREVRTDEDLRALDTPSRVAPRIEEQLLDGGRLEFHLLDAVRRHELIHVLDARDLLPLHHHPIRAVGFALRTGFSAQAAERFLEGRAAALSLAACSEPRAALASILAFLPDVEGRSAHPAAYVEVLNHIVDVIVTNPTRFPEIDQGYNVVQQLDRLPSERVRALGRLLAERY